MSRFLTILLLLTIPSLVSAEESCWWKNKEVEVGESIWIQDSLLERSGNSRDWQGFRLLCVHEVLAADNQNKSLVGGKLKLGKPVLIVNDIQREYFYNVLGKTNKELGM